MGLVAGVWTGSRSGGGWGSREHAARWVRGGYDLQRLASPSDLLWSVRANLPKFSRKTSHGAISWGSRAQTHLWGHLPFEQALGSLANTTLILLCWATVLRRLSLGLRDFKTTLGQVGGGGGRGWGWGKRAGAADFQNLFLSVRCRRAGDRPRQ